MFTSALDISTSALVAERIRMNTIAGNIANASTTHNEAGEAVPYTPRFVVFEPDESVGTSDGAVGVKVSEIDFDREAPPIVKYQPNHPDADERGFVAYPNINMTKEMVDSLTASRAYEANVGVIEVSKNIMSQTLRILG